MYIKTIRNLSELESLRDSWEGWQCHPNSDYEFFKLICQLRKEVKCPHVTIVERKGQPRAVVIARLEQSCFQLSVGYFKLIRIPATILNVVYQGFLGVIDENEAASLVRYMRKLLYSKEADAVVFNHLPELSPLFHALMTECSSYLCEKKPKWSTHWEMTTPDKTGFLQYKVGSKQRWKIRKRQRELEEAFPGKVSWSWMTRFDDIDGICARLEKAAARTYQRKLGAGFVNDREHRERFSLFAGRGQLRVQLLEIEEKAIAFWIGTVYRGVFHSSATGYDPDFSKYEPGTLSFVHIVDCLTEEGVRKFDFGLGDAVYKQRYGDNYWKEGTIRIFAPTVKGFTLRSFLSFLGVLDGFLRGLLQKAERLNRVKTIWRRKMTSDSSDEKKG